MYKQIETERLLIRPIKMDDKTFILNLLNTEGWLQFIGDRNIKNTLDAEIYIQNILNNKQVFYNVFLLKETTQPLGIVTWLHRDNHIFPDIGFAMLPEFTKKGYAFEATFKYMEDIRSQEKFDKILAITQPNNVQSINLIKKLGFKYERQSIKNSQILDIYAITCNTKKYKTRK